MDVVRLRVILRLFHHAGQQIELFRVQFRGLLCIGSRKDVAHGPCAKPPLVSIVACPPLFIVLLPSFHDVVVHLDHRGSVFFHQFHVVERHVAIDLLPKFVYVGLGCALNGLPVRGLYKFSFLVQLFEKSRAFRRVLFVELFSGRWVGNGDVSAIECMRLNLRASC